VYCRCKILHIDTVEVQENIKYVMDCKIRCIHRKYKMNLLLKRNLETSILKHIGHDLFQLSIDSEHKRLIALDAVPLRGRRRGFGDVFHNVVVISFTV